VEVLSPFYQTVLGSSSTSPTSHYNVHNVNKIFINYNQTIVKMRQGLSIYKEFINTTNLLERTNISRKQNTENQGLGKIDTGNCIKEDNHQA
jgi:hypothetical protein